MRTSREESVLAAMANHSEQPGDWRVERLSSVHEIAVVIEAVVSVMAELEYPPKDIFGARMALEEAICNAIKHGHQADPTKVVEIRYRIHAGRFVVDVQDQGPGFNPTQVPDPTAPENLERPCGRGLLLIRHYAAWVRHNQKGNCVTFCIWNSQRPPAEQTAESQRTAGRLTACAT
jgi:serine/threonine-protein kinase RsbW